MPNIEIRNAALLARVPFWKIADALGVHENTLRRMMRYDLPEDKKQEILSIIDKLRKED